MTLTQFLRLERYAQSFLSFPSFLGSINFEVSAGVFFCQSTRNVRPCFNERSELSILSGLYCNRLFFRSALLKRGVLPSKTVYSLGFAQNWKIPCFISGLRTVIVSISTTCWRKFPDLLSFL